MGKKKYYIRHPNSSNLSTYLHYTYFHDLNYLNNLPLASDLQIPQISKQNINNCMNNICSLNCFREYRIFIVK